MLSSSAAAEKEQSSKIMMVGFNLLTSTSIVVANKMFFMSYKVPPMGLAALHLTTCYVAMRAVFHLQNKPLSISTFEPDVAMIGFFNAGAICLQSIAFMHCAVATMQILKLTIMPMLVLLEYLKFGTWKPEYFPSLGLIAVGVVVGGFGDQQHTTFWGPWIVGTSCIFSGMYSTNMKQTCQLRGVSSVELFVPSIPWSVAFSALGSTWFDEMLGADMSLLSPFSTPTVPFILGLSITCFLAILINLTTAMIMVNLSPLTYVVLNPVKTFLTVMVGVVVTSQYPVPWQYLGIPLSLAGVMWYSWVGYQTSLKPKPADGSA